MTFRRKPRENVEINLASLIDVVFILLVFFMLASSFVDWRAIELAPPAAAGAGQAQRAATLVEVRRDGLSLAGEPLALEELVLRVAGELALQPERPVLVRTESGVTLEAVVAVLDRLAAAGASDLTLLRGRER